MLTRKENYKSIQMTQKSRNILKKWLKADYQLFKYFNDLLDQKIQNLGSEKIQQDVNMLKEMNEELKEVCGVKEINNRNWAKRESTLLRTQNRKVTQYAMKQQCALYAISEEYFVEFLSKWQNKNIKKSNN